MDIDLGATYDITEEIDVNAKYSLDLVAVAVPEIFVGAGYNF
ncbi:hypothetical protein [Flavobacterium sp.]|nr:hypothetical protein [Flavobacterium sp.]MDI1317232.1 hypothetical protein [Flavobacterium sp.]